MKKWYWQSPTWPHFNYDPSSISDLEKKFREGAKQVSSILNRLSEKKKKEFLLARYYDLMEKKKIPYRDRSFWNLIWEIDETYPKPLTHKMLFLWHKKIASYENWLQIKGKYRISPIKVISKFSGKEVVLYEALPTKEIYKEMNKFIKWFNDSKKDPSSLARAAIGNLYFLAMHPFEDGNGRTSRMIVEKSLRQSLKQPTFLNYSQAIIERKPEYNSFLNFIDKTHNCNRWIKFFAKIMIEYQEETIYLLNFWLAKSKFLNDLRNKIKKRQEKVLIKMFRDKLHGFPEGLTTKIYMDWTKTSKAVATKDLDDLVQKKALIKTPQNSFQLNVDF
jgi:Fic family protein